MPRKISPCVSLLGCQLLSEGSSEFFPTMKTCEHSITDGYQEIIKGHGKAISFLTVYFLFSMLFDCMHWIRVDTCLDM